MKKKYVIQLEHWFKSLAELEVYTPITKRRGLNRCHLLVCQITQHSEEVKKCNIF